MARIELIDEQPLNVSLSEPQTLNESINPQENINVETTDGWYEKEYTETDPIYSISAASTITEQDIESWNNKSDFSGDYDDLENKPDIPTKTSQLTNDSGFLTEHQDISGKVDKEEGKGLSSNDFTDTYKGNVDSNTSARHTHSNKSVLDNISSSDITNWNNKSTFSGSYNDLTDKPTIPDELSDLSDDSTHRLVTDTEKSIWNAKSDFSGSYNDLTDTPTIPTKTSDLTNDSSYITATNYASNQTGGTIKTDTSTYGTSMYSGYLTGSTRTYTQYGNAANALFVSKGTLENVITGKGLVSNNDLSTVATSGSYTDLTNKPTIPTNLSSFTDDLGNSPTHTHNQYLTSHQDISGKQDTLVSGTNIKTINSQSLLGSGDITISVPGCKEYFGECTTSASTKNKVVDCTGFVLEDGAHISVYFWYGQDATSSTASKITLNVNNTGAKSISYCNDKIPRYAWKEGETIDFTYIATDDMWLIHKDGIADTTYYGLTKLSSSTSSTSESLSATPKAVKQAYDLANSKQDALVSGTNIKTINNESLLGSGNISINTMSDAADYVTECDTDGTWTWRKWKSGWVELFAFHQFTGLNITTSSAGTYYGASPEITLPFTLTELYFQSSALAGTISSGVYVYKIYTTNSGTKLKTEFRAHASSSNASCGVKYYLIGVYDTNS